MTNYTIISKNTLKLILQFFVFVSIGIFLFWLVYRDQPIDQIVSALYNANYFYIGISLVLSFLSHISRALRWNILINSLGYKPKTINTVCSIFIMYLSNTAIPRSGEITRCGILKKYENIPFSQLIGTVIVERVADFMMLLLMFFIVLFTQYGIIGEFLEKNPDTASNLSSLFSARNIVIAVSLFTITLIFLIIFHKKLKTFIIYVKVKDFMKNILKGIKTVNNLDKKWQFIFHTVFIWTMYFCTIYIIFLSFKFTSHLSLITGLTVFVMASFGMIAPSPGGIGTWHFMVIETLIIYGINKYPDANAFAFAAHGSMTLLTVILGIISLVLLPVFNKKKEQIV